MSKGKLIRILFLCLTVIISIGTLLSLRSLFLSNSGILISEKNFHIIKNNIASIQNISSSKLEVTRLFGSKRFIGIAFTDTNKEGFNNTFFSIYDSSSKENINTVEYKDTVIQLANSLYIDYVKDNTFVVIDNKGAIYLVAFNSYKNYDIDMLGTLDVKKEDIKDTLLVNDYLYILTRDVLNNYNEKPFNNPSVLKIDLYGDNKDSNVEAISLGENILPVSLIIDSNKNVGYVSIETVNVDSKYISTYSTSEDKNYLLNLPYSNNEYKLLNSDTYKINYLSGESVDIDLSQLESTQTPFLNKVNRDYLINSDIVSGIPIFINANNNVIYASEEVFNFIHYRYDNSSRLLYSFNEEGFKDYGKYNMNYISFESSNDKDILGYINTNIGTIIIDKNTKLSRLTTKGIGYRYKKLNISIENNRVVYAKAV